MVSENLETEKDDIEEYDISQEENVKVLKKINLNTSSMEELSDLIYVSDEQAELIVDYRNEHGDFKNVDDVQYVEGITGTTVNIIEDYTYVA
ncbi:MAG: helix-hairpin-helix domain-containing protein [Candidatus Metalachnospira sp.]|nr:helix-hairpin-helix domain-containing protein [Candidatus Metalachnospira sp.]